MLSLSKGIIGCYLVATCWLHGDWRYS